MDVFVYYTIAHADAVRARQAVANLHHTLAQNYDVAANLKRRIEQLVDVQTWMEIYPQVRPGFEQVIEQLASEAGVTALIQGARHIEMFEEIEPCA